MDRDILISNSCPLTATNAIIGGKYKLDIVYYLFDNTLRYSEIAKLIKATPKMLTQQLKELERDGIIKRVLFPCVPPKTEYSLTDFGEKLCPAVLEMYKFGLLLYEENNVKPPCTSKDLPRLISVINKSNQ